MTLQELTNHEPGIIIYGNTTVGVFNWMDCDDNQLPFLLRIGTPVRWPEADDVFDDVTAKHVDDIRDEIPGTIRIKEDYGDKVVANTDLDIVYDGNQVMPRLFLEHLEPCDYMGTVYALKDVRKIITPDEWN
jgi:hypothetical protein